MEENRGVLENEGKDEVEADVEAGSISRTTQLSSPNSNIKSMETHKLQRSLSAPEAPTANSVEDEDIAWKAADDSRRLERKKLKKKVALSFMGCMFVCLVGILIASLKVPKLKDTLIWGSELWKWTVFVLVILCGGLISRSLIMIPLILIDKMCTSEVILYLSRQMKRCVRHFVWLGLILLAWVLLISRGVKRSRDTTRILDHVTNALVGCLAGAAIWVIKSFLIRLLAFSFQRRGSLHERYFVQKVFWALSGDPVEEHRSERLKFRGKVGTGGQDVINARKLCGKDLVKRLAKVATGLLCIIILTIPFLICAALVEMLYAEEEDKVDVEEDDMDTTTRKKKSEDAADGIFRNVVNPNCKYVEEKDLRRFMKKKDVDRLLSLLPRAKENKRIEKSLFRNWLMDSCKEVEEFAHSLNYTRRALVKLDRLASGVAIVICFIVWCLIMGILTTNVLVLMSSQIVLAAFMFGNTAKTIFEAIIFVFIMHPFDVGDQCVIDEEQMLVEEIKNLHSIFSRDDMKKVFYPNSVLLTKPIHNSYRHPNMDDSIEFNIDFSTSAETINTLKTRIQNYLDDNFVCWRKHSFVVKDIDNTGNLKMSLSVTHNIGFHSSEKKSSQRSDLILELKSILEDRKIKYRLLPREVHVKYIGPAPSHP